MAGRTARNWSSGDIVTAANLYLIERGVSEVAETYTQTVWNNGDTITAEKLNNIENGIIGASKFKLATITFNLTIPEGHEVGSIKIAYLLIPYPEPVSFGGPSNSFHCENLSIEYTGSIQILMYNNVGYFGPITFYDTNDYNLSYEDVAVNGGVSFDTSYNIWTVTGDGTISIILDTPK